MADAVDIDLYDDDLEQDFAHVKEESIDLYDDVIAGSSEAPASTSGPAETTNDQNHVATTNGPQNTSTARRFQLYVGNLTWWTSDRDITEAIQAIGVNDLVDVKFFENRTNGQSKGFCVIGLASESSMRLCIERLSKQDIHGQLPVVTYPTKQALSQFESQSKTRPVPPPAPNVQRPSAPQPQTQPLLSNSGLPLPLLMPQQQQQQQQSQQQQQAQQQVRVRMPPPNIRPGPPMQAGPPRMNGPPPPHQISQISVQYKLNMTSNGPMQSQLPPNYQGGPPRPGMQPPQGMAPQGRGPAPPNMPFGGPPQMQGMTPRGPPPHPSQQIMNNDARGIRPDWNRPPGPNMQPGGSMFTNHHMQGPPHQVMLPGQGPMHRAPGPGQLSGPSVHGMPPPVSNQGPVHGPPQVNNSSHGHVNPPQYFPPGGPPTGQSGPPPHMSHGPPPPGYSQSSSRPPYSGPDSRDHHMDQDYEEIMSRNRTVSSSAITRAVADAAAGDYESAVETLMTAVSLIKQSKVANDDRCKILISSLQDTIHGIEAKRYVHSRRERSRSRDRERSHRRRRDRSRSRERDYRERSRDREREHRDKDRYYSDMYPRERTRSRDRDRERERERDYRDRSREESSTRVNTRNRVKSPPDTVDPASVATVSSKTSSSRYYEERYRERDRERDRDRDRDSRHVERDRDRDRREERGESSHRSSRH